MSKIKELVKKGKSQGYIEYLDLKNILPEDITDKEQVDEIIQTIVDMGIDVKITKAEVIKLFEGK